MSSESADRNLLFGVLAVQLEVVSRDNLIAATSRWVLDKEQPLSEVFVEQGMISREEVILVEGVVEKHLERNNNDPRRSLHSVEAFDAVRSTLSDLADTEIRASVEYHTVGVVAHDSGDPYSTQGPRRVETAEHRGRFSVLRLHQKGGLGRVSIALDEELHREIALKEILPAHADNEENRTRFVREAEITGALEHPGIVPVYSLGQFADGRPYYAMRFIRGMNLQIALEDYHNQADSSVESQLRFRSLVAKIIHVCHAIEYAHSRGVIHRDLKPGNIMLGDYGETLVVDWGLAKTLEDGFQTDAILAPPVHPTKRASSTSTQVGRVVGTPCYMSPEQAAGRLDALGPTSDIYSLGATLYHVLTGQVAFSGTEEEVLGNVQLGRFPRPRTINRDVPRAIEAICLKAMARMPEERYATAREMADDLERFMGDERVRAYAEPFPVKAWRWIRNHKALVISSAAALAVAVTALTIGIVMVTAAYDRERIERNRAELNFTEATQQRELAERNFELARSAVQDYYIAVSEDTLLMQPGMQGLREELLRQALVYYQSFLDQRQEDPSLHKEVAEAHFFAGKITQTIGSPAEALTHFQKSAQLQSQLLEAEPEEKELLIAYGQTLNAIGAAHLRLGDFQESLEGFEQAAKIREQIAQADPADVEAARTLANSVMNIGSVHRAQGNLELAIPPLERAQMIRMARVELLETADPKLRRDLGMGYYNLALLRLSLGDAALAENDFLTAVSAFESLVESAPDNMNYPRYLAACQRMLADLNADEQPEKAITFYRQAQKNLEYLHLRNPDVLDYAADLAGVYLNLGQQLQLQGQTEAALDSMQQGAEVLQELAGHVQSVPRYRLDLGIALRETGKILATLGQLDQARVQLEDSRVTLSRLVSEEPANEHFTQQLGLTMDALAGLEELSEPNDDASTE